MPDTQLSRRQIKQIFKRHYGAAADLARELNVAQQNISDWFNGVGRSERVAAAIRARAVELSKETK